MFSESIVPSSAGSLCVALIAFFFLVFQIWISIRSSEFSWNGWSAGLSFATVVYATAVFIQFNTAATSLNHYAELLQYGTFLILVHSSYGFTISYLRLNARRYHLIAGIFHGVLLVILWFTKLIISDRFISRDFIWLKGSYVEPELGPLGPFFLIYCILAVIYVWTIWLKRDNRRQSGAKTFIIGFSIWAALGLHDVLATLGVKTIQFLMEYGFLAFSVSVIYVTLNKYIELYHIAEETKADLQKTKDELEIRVKERTAEIEEANRDLQKEIVERKRIEIELRQNEERYRQLVEHAPTGIFEIDYEKLRFINVNDIMLEYTGYTRDEFLSLNPFDVLTPESQEIFKERLGKIISGEPVPDNVEFEAVAKDGRIFWVLLNIRFLYENGNPKRAAVVVHDISQRKEAEQAILESEEKYRTILESIEESYYEVDLAGNLVFFNDSLCQVSGYSRDELVGMNNREYTSPETARKMYQMFHQVYLTGKPAKRSSYEIIRKEGDKRIVELSTSLILGHGGKPAGFRGVLRDVTEYVESEKQKEALESQVQKAQRLESIGTLAGGIAHDFNNLLMGIQGNVSLLLLDVGRNHPHYDSLRNIQEYVQKGSELTMQLLGFARGGKYQVKPTNLNEVLNKSSEMFGRTKKSITIHRAYQADIWTVEVDQGQIEQVLVNLYVNAWQAMPEGGDLYLESKNVVLNEAEASSFQTAPGKYVRISVTDTGIGMDKSIQERLFDPFFTTKEIGRGTGLGLASAYGIIKNHGGIIDVHSKKGRGSTFSLYFPISDKEIITEEEPLKQILKGRETILFVDDEDMIIDVGKQMLERMGYKVIAAKSGKEALRVFEENKDQIDMIILDMIMPDMGGREVYDRIRSVRDDVKVLLSSGHALSAHTKEMLEDGCHGFIQKPFDIEHISRTIRDILDKS